MYLPWLGNYYKYYTCKLWSFESHDFDLTNLCVKTVLLGTEH